MKHILLDLRKQNLEIKKDVLEITETSKNYYKNVEKNLHLIDFNKVENYKNLIFDIKNELELENSNYKEIILEKQKNNLIDLKKNLDNQIIDIKNENNNLSKEVLVIKNKKKLTILKKNISNNN
jgi:hypothetical protein